jgi:hypothetical protein
VDQGRLTKTNAQQDITAHKEQAENLNAQWDIIALSQECMTQM